jgi:hypothetical protein
VAPTDAGRAALATMRPVDAKRHVLEYNQRFADALETKLVELGANKRGLIAMYAYRLETVVGALEDVDRACRVITNYINPYSGKWNHHFFCVPLRTALEQIVREIRRVL